jgi:hypothetical protein
MPFNPCPVSWHEPRRDRIARRALKRTSIRSLRVAETAGEAMASSASLPLLMINDGPSRRTIECQRTGC